MSKYGTYATRFRNRQALVAELILQFKEVEVHDTPQTLYDYNGEPRPDKAEIIVRRQYVSGMSNDVGFCLKDGCYQAVISDYDRHGGKQLNDEWMKKLTTAYNKRVVLPGLVAKGFRMSTLDQQQDGEHVAMVRMR